MPADIWQWFIVALFGGLVGGGELVSRYRDAPTGALRTKASVFYIGINVAASLGALALANAFQWNFGISPSAGKEQIIWTRVLVSGFGAMALFRTSLFRVRAGSQEIGIGPVSFLSIFLNAADREIDRRRAQARADLVSTIMTGLDYAKTFKALPPYCLALMQNLPDEVQEALARDLQLLDKEPMDDSLKIRLLGLALVNVVGMNVLREAVNSLGGEIRLSGPQAGSVKKNVAPLPDSDSTQIRPR